MPPTATRKTPARRSRPKKRPITPHDLQRLLIPGAPQISPDGTRLIFVRKHFGDKNKTITRLWTVDTEGQENPSQFTAGEKDRRPRFSPDGGDIAFIGKRDGPGDQVYVISAAGGEAETLTSFPEGSINAVEWAPDGATLAVSYRAQDPDWTAEAKKRRADAGLGDPPRVLDDWWYRLDGDGYFGAQRHSLYLVDAATGAHRCVYKKDTLGFFSFAFSPDSKKLAIIANQDRKALIKPWKDRIYVHTITSGRTVEVPNLPDGPKGAVAWSPNGKLLAYAGRLGTDGTYSVDNLELFVCDPARGHPRSLTKRTDYCLMATTLSDTAEVEFGACIRWHPDSRRIFVKFGWHGEAHVASVPVRGGVPTFLTGGAAVWDLGNISGDGTRIALIRATCTKPDEVYVGDLDGGELETRAVTALNAPLLKEVDLAGIKSHWIPTADGTKVQAWVMMPPGSPPGGRKKHPGILEIHGGPHAQYGVGFFHEFQVLAAQGCAVVFSNPRGSKGYGRDHCAAIRGNWGVSDWVDIQAVTAFMQDHPNIDAKRMGVMGGSYGGYMTNWVIGHTNDFAGAITDRCVSNIVTLEGTGDFTDAPDHYFPGNTWDRTGARWEQSPMKHIGSARTPTLIIHSEGDLRCNIEQAEQLFTALKLLNVPTRFVRYPRSTSHGMSRSGPMDMRLHRLDQILSWWKRYL